MGLQWNEIIVQAFNSKTNKAANGLYYSINLFDAIDMANVQGVAGVEELVKIAKSDVIHKKWDELKEILKKGPTSLRTDSGIQWQ